MAALLQYYRKHLNRPVIKYGEAPMKTKPRPLAMLADILWISCMFSVVVAQAQDARQRAKHILDATGVKGGLIVHVGCGDGELTAALLANDRYVVHGLEADQKNVRQARRHIQSRSNYGRASVAHWDGKTLPHSDNLVNLLVIEDPGELSEAEMMRVVAPLGVLYVKQGDGYRMSAKPWPKEIDEWRQYLHDADNNAVAKDSVVGPPRHLQWVTDPAWSRSHMAIATVVSMVSSKGRLFTIEDTATVEHPFLPGEFSLIARDAFNGIVLWRHGLAEWEPITRYIKDIAIQLQRRLVAVDNTVYCTPGLEAPLTAFDAATGKVLRTYKGTQRTQEFAYDMGVLYAVIGDRMNAAAYNIVKPDSGKGVNLGGFDPHAPFGGTGFRGSYAQESQNKDITVCSIVAIQAESGKEIWRIDDIRNYTGCTLSIKGKNAAYQTGKGLFCVDARTGGKNWSVEKNVVSLDGTEANVVVLSDTMVYAQDGKSLYAYSIQDGSEQWKAPIANNYEKSADLFLAGGALWTGGSKQPTSYDPESGEQLSTIRQKMTGPMSHDRCYRNFITDRYYINSKTGGADFLELASNKEFPNHWLRGTCGMGVLPCNGMLYAPPYSCQCSIGPMIKNFNAVYSGMPLESSDQMVTVQRKVRLETGPAFRRVRGGVSELADQNNWPTYRYDAQRSGTTRSKVPAVLKPLWKSRFSAIPSAPVIAGGKVFVSDIDAHAVCALDASDGNTAWEYVAEGRVDSPPTWHKGLILFGSRDGWVHCLRASDGSLVWRFKDLPDKLIGAFGQLESAWPICGSVLAKDDTVYFAAGRSSFLDGGIFLNALDLQTGKVKHSRQVYGPFDEKTGFPAADNQGFKGDVLVTDGERLYLRHKAFTTDLKDTVGGPHILPSSGFLDGTPQHRTYWTITPSGGFTGRTAVRGPSGDILVKDGKDYYEVRGFPVHRHSYFDTRVKGYKLIAGTLNSPDASTAQKKTGNRGKGRAASGPAERWSEDIPLTGKAMVLAGETLFVAGTPVYFPPDHPVEKYVDAYKGKLGGVLWVASAKSGEKLAQYELEAAPAWDGMAAAYGKLFICLKDGTMVCMGPDS